jgi:excisionase family DNA binding protein
VADGDALAALAVVRSVLPGVRRAAGRRWRTGRDDGLWRRREDVDGDAVAAAWESIDRHAGERHRWPARVIVRRVERSLRSGHDAHRNFIHRTEPLAAHSTVAAVDEYGAWTSAEGTALLVVDAVRTGRLDPVAAALVFAVAVLGLNVSDAGRRLGLDRRAVYRSLGDAHRLLDHAARASPKGADAPQRIQPRIPNLVKENFPMLPLLLTVKQAADLMGVGRTTLYELMDAGEVYSVHRGASRRVPLWAVYDYVDRLCDGQFRRVPLPAVVPPGPPGRRTGWRRCDRLPPSQGAPRI